MPGSSRWFAQEMKRRGVSRRDFTKFCAGIATWLSLPKGGAAQVAKALEKVQKPAIIWLEFQDCTGDSESLLRATRPSTAELVLDVLSLDYHETIMAAAGHQAEAAKAKSIADNKGKYLVVVEGSIPKDDVYCTIGGRGANAILKETAKDAAGIIAIGSCAAFGGLPAAAPNPTGAMSVSEALGDSKKVINLPACPTNVESLVALIVYFLTFKRWPALDSDRRPLFAHGKSIHDNCERRAHFDAGQYVNIWGDEGHRAGFCLYKVGCKGPVTYNNCPNIRWNDGTNWPVGCGHPCIGCAEPDFWDKMTPFYRHLAGVPGFRVHTDVDVVGGALVGATFAGVVGHGLVQLGRRKLLGGKPPPPPPAAKPHTTEKAGGQ